MAVLQFPSARKRPYRNPYVRRDALPEGVVLLPSSAPYQTLRRSPEMLLLMAILVSMEAPIRWRIANEIRRGAEQPDTRDIAADLSALLMNLPFYIPEVRQ